MAVQTSTWRFEHDGTSSFGTQGVRADTMSALENWAARAPGRTFDWVEELELSNAFIVRLGADTADAVACDELDLACVLIGLRREPVRQAKA